MATTTNYSWSTPDDTSLVKDGAAAIRTLGSSIDTTTKALNPSTTLGDMEYRSSTANTNTRLPIGANGKVLGVVAGVPAWVDADPLTILDAKGDLITATAADTPARLAIGSNNQVLTADSSTATGLKWATPATSTPTFVGCDVYTDVDQSISNNTHTTVNFELEYIDSDSFHSNVTNNSRITIPTGKAGKYRIFGQISYLDNATGGRRISIAKNGSRIRQTITPGSSNSYNFVTAEAILDLIVGDYLELQAFQNSGGSLSVGGTLGYTHFSAEYIGA